MLENPKKMSHYNFHTKINITFVSIANFFNMRIFGAKIQKYLLWKLNIARFAHCNVVKWDFLKWFSDTIKKAAVS